MGFFFFFKEMIHYFKLNILRCLVGLLLIYNLTLNMSGFDQDPHSELDVHLQDLNRGKP